MAYPQDYDITNVYYTKWLEIYQDVYDKVYNTMKEKYKKDEQALQSACATVMIAFTQASNMNMPGVITWDASAAGETPEFKTFATLKSSEGKSGGYQKSGGSGGYKGGGGYKKYDGPKELKGEASQKQVDLLRSFLEDKNPAVSKLVADKMAELEISDPEEFSKQDASELIDSCFKARARSGKK